MRFGSAFSYLPYLMNKIFPGTGISSDRLTKMIYLRNDVREGFKYPEGREMRINGIISKELLESPDLFDNEGKPALSSSNRVLLPTSWLDVTPASNHSVATKTASNPWKSPLTTSIRGQARSQTTETLASKLSSTASAVWLLSSTLGSRRAAA